MLCLTKTPSQIGRGFQLGRDRIAFARPLVLQTCRCSDKGNNNIKDWESMSVSEKAIELYVGEKGLLFWLNKLVPISNHAPKPMEAACSGDKIIQESSTKILGLAVQVGGFFATVAAEPAFGVTGVNDEEDLVWTLIQLGISAFFYFLVIPPILMNWLRIRWYRRNLAEMYVQFMFVFLFFPGVLLWAPFLNFRKFPRDPSMKYPWSTPQDPSKIKGGFLKYPWAKPEDYQV